MATSSMVRLPQGLKGTDCGLATDKPLVLEEDGTMVGKDDYFCVYLPTLNV